MGERRPPKSFGRAARSPRTSRHLFARRVASLVAASACALLLAPSCRRETDVSKSTPPAAATASAAHAPASSAAAKAPVASAIVAIPERERSSSSIALARVGDSKVLLVADEDDAMLRLLSLPAGKSRATAELRSTPAHVVVADDGVVYVSLRDADAVASFVLDCAGTACRFVERARIPTAMEPIALAVTKDRLLVASGFGRMLEAFDRTSGARLLAAPVAREPRAFVLSRDERTAFVTHAAASVVSVVSLQDASSRELRLDYRDYDASEGVPLASEPRYAAQGYVAARLDERIVAPLAIVHSGELDRTPGLVYGGAADTMFAAHEPNMVLLRDTPSAQVPRLMLATKTIDADESRKSSGVLVRPPTHPPCLLPRAIAVDRRSRTVLVACIDIGVVLELHPGAPGLALAERRRHRVPSGPVALAVDDDDRSAWVWSAFDRRVSRLALSNPSSELAAGASSIGAKPSGSASIGKKTSSWSEDVFVLTPTLDPASSFAIAPSRQLGAAWNEGRRIFHSPIARDGRACASCHPDGRDDGIVWLTPLGPLQTPTLAGRLDGTSPFGWTASSATLEAHVQQTLKRLEAKPLEPSALASLVVYLRGMPTYLAKRTPKSALELRGQQLFESAEVGCSRCHARGGVGTDGLSNSVGTGGSFDTPSLRFVSGTPPYMHDGRYSTLREVLVGTEGKMGVTKHLSEADVSALIAYLATL